MLEQYHAFDRRVQEAEQGLLSVLGEVTSDLLLLADVQRRVHRRRCEAGRRASSMGQLDRLRS